MASQEELRKELVQPSRNVRYSDVKSLSAKLEEMGFDKGSFMVLKYETKVGDHRNQDGSVTPDPYLSCGPEHRHPSGNGRTDGEWNDEYIGAAIGGLGANNGMYSAQAKYGDEIIITEDREIYNALQQLGFKGESLGVPMSNGGIFVDYNKQQEFQEMKVRCAQKRDREGQENRTAAVQRGDIITTYDPNDKYPDGVYKNVRHYEKMPDGSFASLSTAQASHKLQTQLQYEANMDKTINKGEKLDSNVVQKMLSNSWVRY